MNYREMFEEDVHETFKVLNENAKESYDVIEGIWYVFDNYAILIDTTGSEIKRITIDEWNKNKNKILN